VVPVGYLPGTCRVPAGYLPSTCQVPAGYLLGTCRVPARYVRVSDTGQDTRKKNVHSIMLSNRWRATYSVALSSNTKRDQPNNELTRGITNSMVIPS